MTVESIYNENRDYIFKYILKTIRNREDAEELTNDVFMRVVNNFERYDSKLSKPRTWIVNITKNIIIDYWRKKKLQTVSLEEARGEDLNVNFKMMTKDSGVDALSKLIDSEKRSSIELKIDAIENNKIRTVAKLFFIDQLKYDEIVDALQLPLNTVKNTVWRARKELQVELKEVKA